MYLDGLCVQFLCLKIIQTFRINKYINWTFKAVSTAIVNMLLVYFLLIPYLLSMTFYAYYQMGEKVPGAQSFFCSMFGVYRLLLGSVNIKNFFEASPIDFSVYCFTLVLYFFYLLQPLSISVLLDSFDNTVKTFGHSSDLGLEESWTAQQLWQWVIDIHPTRKLK